MATDGSIGGRVRGQAALELALVLPLVLALLLLLAQMGLVLRHQVLVVHAAREGARAAAVDPTHQAARSAVLGAANLDPRHVQVLIRRNHGPVPTITVTVTYRSTTEMPVVGPFLGDVTIIESVTMRLEDSGPL